MVCFRRSGFLLVALSAVTASCGMAKTSPARSKAGHGRSSVASRSGFHAANVGLATVLAAHKAIVVDKSEKTLTLFKDGTPRKTYPIAIGKAETGAKQRAGDWKTPEGLYSIAAHHPGSRYYKALKISYPNARDAARGLATGLITAEQAAAIEAALENGQMPPQDTRLGYNIEIHGGYRLAAGDDAAIRGYTRGCMAVTNTMINEIYNWAEDGTPVLIRP